MGRTGRSFEPGFFLFASTRVKVAPSLFDHAATATARLSRVGE
jgi:hypothetical protein